MLRNQLREHVNNDNKKEYLYFKSERDIWYFSRVGKCEVSDIHRTYWRQNGQKNCE